MKIIDTRQPVDIGHLTRFLQHHLNRDFAKQRQTDLEFSIAAKGDTVEITKPDLYEGFLFRIEAHGSELHIIKSEDYTDDINVLTLEDIMNNLFMAYPGGGDISYIGEE